VEYAVDIVDPDAFEDLLEALRERLEDRELYPRPSDVLDPSSESERDVREPRSRSPDQELPRVGLVQRHAHFIRLQDSLDHLNEHLNVVIPSLLLGIAFPLAIGSLTWNTSLVFMTFVMAILCFVPWRLLVAIVRGLREIVVTAYESPASSDSSEWEWE
jgi:hypothetical protein